MQLYYNRGKNMKNLLKFTPNIGPAVSSVLSSYKPNGRDDTTYNNFVWCAGYILEIGQIGLTETEHNNLKANPKKWSSAIKNAKFFLGESAINENVQSSVNIYAELSYGMHPVFLYAPYGIHRSDTVEIWVANSFSDTMTQ